jgi:transcriptional regulator with XRE-family HTH domain
MPDENARTTTSGTRSRLGEQVRTARLDRDWTQLELASRSGVSRPMISAIEHGGSGVSLEALERVCGALDGQLVLDLHAPLAIGRADQRDAAYATCTAAVRRALERTGYTCVTEHPFTDGRLRGWIDLLAFDPATGRLLVVEIKTELRDLGGLQRQVGWYERTARDAARDLGWRVRTVDCLVVFLATEANDTALEANRELIERTFPVRGRALRVALESRRPLGGWGLILVDPRRRGGRVWLGLRLDGRRRSAPYRSYADFMRGARSGGPTAPGTRSGGPTAPDARSGGLTAPSARRASRARRSTESTSRGPEAGHGRSGPERQAR